jgi:hypothetical protein
MSQPCEEHIEENGARSEGGSSRWMRARPFPQERSGPARAHAPLATTAVTERRRRGVTSCPTPRPADSAVPALAWPPDALHFYDRGGLHERSLRI